jgi:general secretion pathway protein D
LCRLLTVAALGAALAGCAAGAALRQARQAEQLEDYDRAVVEYMKAVRLSPANRDARLALERAKLKAAQAHFFRGRRLAAALKDDEALLEFQVASELNPTDADIAGALRDARAALRVRLATRRADQTELESLIERTRHLPPPGLDLPADITLPDSLVFRDASARQVFTALARFANLNVVFDPAFRDSTVSVDLRKSSLEEALTAIATSTRNFYRVTAQRTITIVPDNPAKRREYEEQIVRTFYVSNADLKETIDLLRIVADVRKIAPITATNAISVQDTPERVAATARLISAIDKARPEVVIDVELLEVDRSRLREYGLQPASPGSPGISGSFDVNREDLTLRTLRSLTQADIFASAVPGLYYRLLKTDSNTRVLANPHLRTSEGIPAEAKFGEEVPVPTTIFAPIAAGGVNQQPITSFTYRNIGVNINITPRTHHNDDVSLALKIEISSISGTGFNDLQTFGTRSVTATIRLKDGETNMLAGLIRDDERRVLNGVPGLSDVPVIGRLFGHRREERQETDIILTLTPHIIRVLDLDEADLRPFRMGRDVAVPAPELPGAPAPGKPGGETEPSLPLAFAAPAGLPPFLGTPLPPLAAPPARHPR